MNKKFNESVSDINKSITINLNPLALRCRGKIYYEMGRYQEALRDFNKSLNIEHDNATIDA